MVYVYLKQFCVRVGTRGDTLVEIQCGVTPFLMKLIGVALSFPRDEVQGVPRFSLFLYYHILTFYQKFFCESITNDIAAQRCSEVARKPAQRISKVQHWYDG